MSGARAVAPELPPPAALRLPPLQRHVLRNGLDVFLVERHELPVVDVRLVLETGAAADPQEVAGRAFLTADLLQEGTASRTSTQIADEAELLGASLFTRAVWDYTTCGLHVLTPRLEPALELLADVTLRPAFREGDVARKRAERLAAILQEEDDPRAIAANAFLRAVYGAQHPFGAPLGGTRASVERLSAADLRALHDAAFVPSGAFLVLVGDVTPQLALDLAERLLGEWHGVRPEPQPLPPAPVRDRIGIRIIDRTGAPQSELRIGLPGPPRASPDFFPLLVANTTLGGAFTSRLNMRLREEKAYTYGASSNFSFRRAGGPFVAATAVATAATADAVNDVVNEVRRLGAERVTDSELERAKSYLVLGLPRTFETTGDIAEHVAEVALHELGSDYYERFADDVAAVTPARVQDAAARWLCAERLSVVVVGDAAVVEDELRSLGIGTVEVGNG